MKIAMKKSPLVVLGIVLGVTLAAAPGRADEEHHRRSRGSSKSAPRPSPRGAFGESPMLSAYTEECGSCHMAYPPGLLPARSWSRILGELDRHFGQNAEMDAEPRAALERWLVANAAESGAHPKSKRVLKSAGTSTPLRLSELRFIAHEHDEIDRAAFSRPSVGSVANCGACHLGADRWSFSEREIRVPRN
ncbi:MAG: diheme cytochrome c [Deltaproteobacteria bacterium]|nr:diheme cytochrome c [Deltaproteobacteria bacterium]